MGECPCFERFVLLPDTKVKFSKQLEREALCNVAKKSVLGRAQKEIGGRAHQLEKLKTKSAAEPLLKCTLGWIDDKNCFRNLHAQEHILGEHLNSPLLHLLAYFVWNATTLAANLPSQNIQEVMLVYLLSHTKSTKWRNYKSDKTTSVIFFLHLICPQLEGTAETTVFNLKISKHEFSG